MHLVIRHHDSERTEFASYPLADAEAVIDALSGRPGIGRYIMATAIPHGRRKGRPSAYVQSAQASPWRTLNAPRRVVGFHAEVCDAHCHFYPFGGVTACEQGHTIGSAETVV